MQKYSVTLLVFSLLIAGSVLAYTTVPEARNIILVYETSVGDIELDPFMANHLIDNRGRAMALVPGGIPAGTNPGTLKKYLEGRGVSEKVIKGLFTQAGKVDAPTSPGMNSWSEIAPLFIKALEGGKVKIVEVYYEDPMFWVGYVPRHPIDEVAVLSPHYWACKETLRVYEVQDVVVEGYRLCLGFMEPCGNLVFLGAEKIYDQEVEDPPEEPEREEPIIPQKPLSESNILNEDWVGPSFTTF